MNHTHCSFRQLQVAEPLISLSAQPVDIQDPDRLPCTAIKHTFRQEIAKTYIHSYIAICIIIEFERCWKMTERSPKNFLVDEPLRSANTCSANIILTIKIV